MPSLTDTTGCILDLDATVMSQSDGTDVTSFTDSSTNAWHHNVEATAWPIFKTNQQNGKSCVRFADGINDAINGPAATTNGLHLTAGYSLVSVVRMIRPTRAWFGKNSHFNNDSARRRLQTGFNGLATGNDGYTASTGFPTPGVNDVFIQIITINTAGTTVQMRLNGTDFSSFVGLSQAALTVGGTNNNQPSIVGGCFSTNPSAEKFSGDVYEHAIFDHVLSPSEITTVESLLSSKFNIPLTGYRATTFGIDLDQLPNLGNVRHWTDIKSGNAAGYVDGNSVAQIFSRNGTTWDQATAGNRPVYKTDHAVISRDYINPDGSDDWMQLSGAGTSGDWPNAPYTTFIVKRWPSGGSIVVGKGNTGDGGAGRRYTYYQYVHLRGGDSGTAADPGAGEDPGTDWNVMGFRVTNNSTVAFRIGNQTTLRNQVTASVGGSFNAAGTNSNDPTLWCSFPGGVEGGGNQDIAAIITLGVALSDVDFQTWTEAVGAMYGFTWGAAPVTSNIKTFGSLGYSDAKTFNGLATSSVKDRDGLA